jgi:ketosteroid isomerase-like protein
MTRRCLILFCLMASGCAATAQTADPARAEAIIALERGALDRWIRGDPQGYLVLYARDVTYFDPQRDARVNGADTMRTLLEPLTGKMKADRYEMLAPRVQGSGDVAVLTYNLVSHGRAADGSAFLVRWNSTAVYGRVDGHWRIVHSHWSLSKPDLKMAAPL